MADPAHIAAMVVVSAAITWILRALPFAVLAPMRRSIVVRYLNVHMPLGIMTMLAFLHGPGRARRSHDSSMASGGGLGCHRRPAPVATQCAAVTADATGLTQPGRPANY